MYNRKSIFRGLISMFCKKSVYFKMQKIHQKTLRVIYQSDKSNERILNLNSCVYLHQKHLRILITEIFKNVSKANPETMWSYFSCNNLSDYLMRAPAVSLSSVKSTVYGTDSVHFKGTLIWNILP